jgi:hypothetical protein
MSPMRIFAIWAMVLLAPAVPAVAQNAVGEVAVALGCPVSPCRFRQGEVIQLKLNFTAARAGYAVQATTVALRERGMDSFTAAPAGRIGDPLEGSRVWMNPSGMFGMPPLLPGEPFSVPVELNQWIRFGGPGKYQVTAQSSRTFWIADAPGARRQQTLVSNPMDIEIVPADAQWQKEQLALILPELPAPAAGYSALAAAAVRALGYLGSDDALREIRKHLAAGPNANDTTQGNYSYPLEWEMARLELLRHAAFPGR